MLIGSIYSVPMTAKLTPTLFFLSIYCERGRTQADRLTVVYSRSKIASENLWTKKDL